MSAETVVRLEKFDAPYGRKIELLEVRYDGGMTLLRLRIREGTRFTVMDLDPETAAHWGDAMSAWAGRHRGGGAPEPS